MNIRGVLKPGFPGRAVRAPVSAPRPTSSVPDLQTQLEDMLLEVWRQESFERAHPFTCGVIREAAIR